MRLQKSSPIERASRKARTKISVPGLPLLHCSCRRRRATQKQRRQRKGTGRAEEEQKRRGRRAARKAGDSSTTFEKPLLENYNADWQTQARSGRVTQQLTHSIQKRHRRRTQSATQLNKRLSRHKGITGQNHPEASKNFLLSHAKVDSWREKNPATLCILCTSNYGHPGEMKLVKGIVLNFWRAY